jgi:hypothetical protein
MTGLPVFAHERESGLTRVVILPISKYLIHVLFLEKSHPTVSHELLPFSASNKPNIILRMTFADFRDANHFLF